MTTFSDSPDITTIDAKGLKCPMPVIKLQQQIRSSQPGELVAIECTDPGAEKDIVGWAKVNKHELIAVDKTDFGLKITLRVGQRNPV